jgi:hypothetical protein
MNQQLENREYTPSPIEQIRQFVTRIWEHPLVDQITREHREQAKTKLAFLLSSYGVDPSTFITVPVGSLIWATDSESDFDYQLVFDTRADKHQMLAILANHETEINEALNKEKARVVANYPISADSFLESAAFYANFLFTPDEYIGGNIELVRKIRLAAVQKMIADDYSDGDWHSVVESRFNIFFKKWDDLSLHLSRMYKHPKADPSRDRTKRIEERLEKRASQTHNPEKYMEAFRKARSNLQMPDFKTYSQAILSSQGELHLLPRFAATGIN